MSRKEKIQNEKKKQHKALKIIEIIVIIIIIIAGILFGLAYGYMSGKLSKIKYENIIQDDESLGISKENTINKKYRNIVLLGVDSLGDNFDTENRTDCIIVASINNETDEVRLFSIYRDTYVQMEENGEIVFDKINHAYYGGVENTIKTINSNADLDIKEYVLVNFKSIADMVDSVGGVNIDIDSDELQYINGYIDSVAKVINGNNTHITSTGTKNLNGVQAVAYSRIRYTDGKDYKRTERMREVLNKIIEKVKKLDAFKINDLLDKLLPELRTNLTSNDIQEFITKVLDYKITKNFGWPYKTKSIYLRTNYYGPAITLESNVIQLHKELFEQDDYVLPSSIKEISDKIVKETGLK